MTSTFGYSHALFSQGTNLRKFALEVDKKENGGNNNGLIDGTEIESFKKLVEQKSGVIFDFSKLKEVGKRTIPIQDDNRNWLYNNTTEVANTFRGVVTTKTIDWLNGKKDGKDLFVSSRRTLDIPTMSDNDFRTSINSVNAQEEKVSKALAKKTTEKQAELHERTKSTAEKVFEWIF